MRARTISRIIGYTHLGYSLRLLTTVEKEEILSKVRNAFSKSI